MTVVADAGMLSAKNLAALSAAGYHYIVGSRLNKIPYDIAEYTKTKELTDQQIITSKLAESQRVIYQYRAKRAVLLGLEPSSSTGKSIRRTLKSLQSLTS